MPERKGRPKRQSWRQRALQPGSQDALRSSAEPPSHDVAETCGGRDQERVDHQHQHPLALAHHLEGFLSHTWAPRFVLEYGVDLINIALRELPHRGQLRSPAGWLTQRVRDLARGAGEVGSPVSLSEDRQGHLEDYLRRWSDYPEKYLEEYRRRRGRLPWEGQGQENSEGEEG